MLAQLAAAESRHRMVGVDVHFLMSAGRNNLLPYADLKPALIKQHILKITSGVCGQSVVMRRKKVKVRL